MRYAWRLIAPGIDPTPIERLPERCRTLTGEIVP